MKEWQNFNLDELMHFSCKANALQNNYLILKALVSSILEDIPDKEIVVSYPELWDAIEESNLNIEEVQCMCCEEQSLRFYIGLAS